MQNIGYVKVNNLPLEYERYIVARLVDGELWFYGSWNDEAQAKRAAKEFENGLVVEISNPSPEEFFKLMKNISENDDLEIRHSMADGYMCGVLENLGYGEGVKVFAEMDRWYS